VSNVVDLLVHRPHIVVNGTAFGGEVHVYPRAYFERFVRGEDVEPLPPDVQRAIVSDWLADFGGNE
jgi:hypothetical protein